MRRFVARISGALGRAIAALNIGPREGGLLIGLGLLGYGAGIVWWPAGFVIPGAVLVYVSIVGVKA